jgi:phage FluMu protein Com
MNDIATVGYWDYDSDLTLTCPSCGWSGPARGLEEAFESLLDVKCPRCRRILLVVLYPTDAETRAAAAAGNPEAIAELPRVAARAAVHRLRQSHELVDPAALPELPGDRLVIEWDIESGQPPWTVLRHEHVEFWREPAYWEGVERLRDVARILQARFGERLVEVTPTEASKVWLYGDRHRAHVVTEINQALQRHEPL